MLDRKALIEKRTALAAEAASEVGLPIEQGDSLLRFLHYDQSSIQRYIMNADFQQSVRDKSSSCFVHRDPPDASHTAVCGAMCDDEYLPLDQVRASESFVIGSLFVRTILCTL